MPPLSRGVRSLRALPKSYQCHFQTRRNLSGRERLFKVSDEVQDALSTGKPVVALETTIYTHGFPYPENVALASKLESLVRIHGGVPATIGILNGVAHVGLEPEELIELISTAGSPNTWKISRRDLGFIGGFGMRGDKLHGGTTIAGTMILAHLAGIKIFATGGLGGVHRGGENSMDISADLTELGRTPVTVVSSGCKSFLDIPRTLEYLETQGVGVGTFADGRQGHVDFPAFFSRDSGVKSPKVLVDEIDAAAVVYAQSQLGIQSGLLFANPVPEESAMSKQEIDKIIEVAVAEAEEKGISGSANTPYILKRIRELSNGASISANEALIESNIIRGTKVAVELAKLDLNGGMAPKRSDIRGSERSNQYSQSPSTAKPIRMNESKATSNATLTKSTDVIVAGSLASDTICDFKPFENANGSYTPALQTSNPSQISQSAGGVGRNVAMAAHLAGANVVLASVVANDIVGKSLVDELARDGLATTGVRQLDTTSGARTAQYVAVNDSNKDLVLAMADMSILTRPELESLEYWESTFQKHMPKWAVVDANWAPSIVSAILTASKYYDIPIAFEPVSTAKASLLFQKQNTALTNSTVVPNHVLSLSSPNALELTAMYDAARTAGLFESEHWWGVIDSFNMPSSGSRQKLVYLTNPELVDQGVPQQTLQLLPYIPQIVTKLGSQGCLLTMILQPGDSKLTDPASAQYILSRSLEGQSSIGGVYMRLFPPSEKVKQEDILSVNGIGDTMLGVILACLVKGQLLDQAIPLAQEAAVLTLKSTEAVSPAVRDLQNRIG